MRQFGSKFHQVASCKSRRIHIRASLREGQTDRFEGLEGAFLRFGGVPNEVLLDNEKPLVEHHDAVSREVRRFNARLQTPDTLRTSERSAITIRYRRYHRSSAMAPGDAHTPARAAFDCRTLKRGADR